MPKEKDCKEKMVLHWKRFFWNINPKNIFSSYANPVLLYTNEKSRKAIEDILHSFTNLFVEWCRACPYRAGHWFQISFLFNLILTFLLMVVIL